LKKRDEMEFTREYQLELLGKVCAAEFLSEVGYVLSEEMFDPDVGEIFEKSLKMFSKTGKALSRGQLLQLCRGKKVHPVFTNSNGSFDKQEILEFAKYMVLRRAGLEFHQFHEAGEYDRAVTLFNRLKMPRLTCDDAPDILRGPIELLRRVKLVPTGLSPLDRILKGGLGAGDVGCILAPTSGGKSSFLVWLGGTAALLGKRVFHLTLEIPKAEVEAKYRSRFLKREQPEEKKTLKTFFDEWAQYRKVLVKRGSVVQVRRYAPYEISVLDLEAELPPQIDLLIVDYLDFLRTPKGSISMGYEELGLLAVELRRISVQKNIPIWTGSQINRAAYQKDVAEVQDVEGAIKKMQACTQVLSLNQSEKERKVDAHGVSKGTLYVAKNTFGRRADCIEMELNWASCQFEAGDVS